MDMEIEGREITQVLPALAMRGIVMFPTMTLHFDVGREQSMKAIRAAMGKDKKIFLAAQKDFTVETPENDDIYAVGVVARIVQLLNNGKNSLRIMVEGLYKAEAVRYDLTGEYYQAEVKRLYDNDVLDADDVQQEAMMRAMIHSFDEYVEMIPKMPEEIITTVLSQKTVKGMYDKIVQSLFLQVEDKQQLLEETDLAAKVGMLVSVLDRETSVMGWERDIYDQVKDSMDKNQRDYFLREQLRVISAELGEGDSPMEDSMYFSDAIQNIQHITDEAKEKLLRECDRLYRTPPQSQEGQVIRTYLETVTDLPWDTVTEDHNDVARAEKILNRDHYGMEKVKKRILESIAVRTLAPEIKGQILCLVGPPGVGKTSIAKSVAEALGRKYVRISLGGVRDEAEIRGHRKTYLGSMPGRIIDAIKQAGSRNPLILLDEIDKMSADYKGDPSSAMLEVLDPEQNVSFRDHYLEVPFDLSDVLFITTANDAGMIPGPLLDRMEMIEMSSYTREEKWHIARRHLLPKQMKKHGLTSSMLKVSKSALYALIDGYTREAGVRQLERELASVCRKAARKIVSGDAGSVSVTGKNLAELLGVPRYIDSAMEREDLVGVVNGLAWTSVGGEMLEIETIILPGTGKIQITGQLGEVMTESAQIAVSLVRSFAERYGIDPEFYKKNDIHIHAPEGAVPKDGPSAGVTMTTCLVSALSGMAVDHSVAMTGEITLHGRVLPIGGLREKSMAAYRRGIKTVFIPWDNQKDLEEIDEVVKEHIAFVPVKFVSEILDRALIKRSPVATAPALPKDKGVPEDLPAAIPGSETPAPLRAQ
ncbi:MAG TPA: endopeptidase La [Candidatus Faecivivens stercoravium]|uniref:Lon protease n=1 Tax=Candidatus Faecivivens stercoravium TaxID=2840803 RepID=A0A9D1DW29_9FIRM|nr:endopeptidase La [Candidatus Faecivivens stercoravium]